MKYSCVRFDPSVNCPLPEFIHWRPTGEVPVVGYCTTSYILEGCEDNREGGPVVHYCYPTDTGGALGAARLERTSR